PAATVSVGVEEEEEQQQPLRLFHFFRYHLQRESLGAAEDRRERELSSIPADRHENATDASLIMTCIEGVPFVTEKNFEPCAKIHRIRSKWNSDIAEVTGDIPCRNIEAATKGNREMHKIAAHAFAVAINLQCALLRVSEMITKGDVLMHPITNRLHTGPARSRRTEKPPGFIISFVHLAITA